MRICKEPRGSKGPCGAPPLKDGDFCLWHDPAQAEIVAEARKAGGSRRKREATIAVAYDFEGLQTTNQIRRLVEVAILDTLALDNTVSRNRTLAYLAQTASKLLEFGEHEDRIQSLEAALEPRLVKGKRR